MTQTNLWHVGVVIPACNEEETIAQSIDAVRAALAHTARLADSWIVVACDSCQDNTRERASTALGAHGEIIECHVGSAGTARRLGTAAVLAHFGQAPRSRLWIANTDADTCVGEDWLSQHLSFADQGCAGVAGIVSVTSVDACDASQLRQLFAGYEIHADGTHPHIHGANLGVRADAYLDAGGWNDKALAEDHCLWQRLKQCQWPVISSATSVVVTSGRLIGRARGGFADTLRLRMAVLYG